MCVCVCVFSTADQRTSTRVTPQALHLAMTPTWKDLVQRFCDPYIACHKAVNMTSEYL